MFLSLSDTGARYDRRPVFTARTGWNGDAASGRREHLLHPDTARRLSCDASLVTVLEDDAGEVLNIGRRSRIVPPHIQRALATRDRCHCRQYTDAHHVKHWAGGGETSLDNPVTLCRHHHRALHQGEFTVDHDLVFRDRDGKKFPETFTPAYAGRPDYDDASQAILSVQKMTDDISYETCRTL